LDFSPITARLGETERRLIDLRRGRRSNCDNAGLLHESNQLRHRRNAEFLHYSPAMKFHGLLRKTELAANLFIQHSGNHQLHHFELAWS